MISLFLGAWLYSRHGWPAIGAAILMIGILEITEIIWPRWSVHLAYALGQMTRGALVWGW